MIKRQRPRLVPFAILTTITLLTWAILDIWRTFTNPAPIQVDEALLKEFIPSFDANVVEELKTRVFFNNEESRSAIPVATESAKQDENIGGTGE